MVLREPFDAGGIQNVTPDFVVKLGLDAFGHTFKQVDLAQGEFIVLGFVTSREMRKHGTDVHGTFGIEKFQ